MFRFTTILHLIESLCCFGIGGGGDSGAGAARQAEAVREAKIAAATAGINQQFSGFDEPYFNNIAEAYKQFQNPLFAEQLDVARRKLPMRFATTGSSAFQREAGNLERDASRQQSQIQSQAEDFANQQRGQVESNRSDLIAQANAGTDAAASAAQAVARANALSKPPAFSPIADLFQKYTANYANAALADRAGYNTGFPSSMYPQLSFGVPKSSVTVQR